MKLESQSITVPTVGERLEKMQRLLVLTRQALRDEPSPGDLVVESAADTLSDVLEEVECLLDLPDSVKSNLSRNPYLEKPGPTLAPEPEHAA